MADEPHVRRGGWLKHGNPPGDLGQVSRCGARTRSGPSCRQPAMRNGRCRMHGGKSTGPRTPEGLERSRKARLVHGRYAAAVMADRREEREVLRALKRLVCSLS